MIAYLVAVYRIGDNAELLKQCQCGVLTPRGTGVCGKCKDQK